MNCRKTAILFFIFLASLPSYSQLIPNLNPIAIAGLPQVTMLPDNRITLIGSGLDLDGSIATYQWAKTSGPDQFTIITANQARTDVSNLVQGIYTFELTVTDNRGATAKSSVLVTVTPSLLPANDGPLKNIVKVGVGEYSTLYITDENKLYGVLWNNNRNKFMDMGLSNVVDIDGAQYHNIVRLTDGSVRVVRRGVNGLSQITTVPTDSYGNAFTGNSKIYGWFQAYLTIKNDSVYYWGLDNLRIAGDGNNTIAAPVKLGQPAGRQVKKVVVRDIFNDQTKPLLVLCTDGTVWEYTRGSAVPVQKTINGTVTDLVAIGRACNVAITSDNRMYAWGPYTSYVGLADGVNTPTSIENTWKAAGMTFPIKEAVGNWNTLHIIDANDNMFACGDNQMGEIGNGRQNTNWKNYAFNGNASPFAWSWARNDLYQSVVQVPGKFKNVTSSNSIAFYLFAQDCNNNWYSWGRNKVCALGNGQTRTNDPYYPNWGDVPSPTFVSPSTIGWVDQNFDINAPAAPLAHAGVGQCVSGNSTTLSAAGSSQQSGSITSYAWSMISGPGANITSPNAVTTTVTGLSTGSYIFRVTVVNNFGIASTNDIRITVNAPALPVNAPPLVVAGGNHNITLPVSQASLSSTATDVDGTVTGYRWYKVGGPSQFTISTPSQATTTVTGLVQGTYFFEIVATDDDGAMGRDTVTVTVNAAIPANQPPVAIAGTQQEVTLPVDWVNLNGTGTDADGTIASYRWNKVSGPALSSIVTPDGPQTTVLGLQQGQYKFELVVTDNLGAKGRDTIDVAVLPVPLPPPPPPANIAPTAIAGQDQIITLPLNIVSLSGTGTDPDGTIVSYKWSKVSGPNLFSLLNLNLAQTLLSSLAEGVYQFELEVKDDKGATGKDTLSITVNPLIVIIPANHAPVADAGSEKEITLPVNSTTLTGNGTDDDGSVVSYKWNKIAGPAQFNIATASQANTAITGLAEGSYKFELVVTDNNGATGSDTVIVKVNAAIIPPNQAPTAWAGNDQSITLPANSIQLSGTGSDPDGSITTYSWKLISGPSSYDIANPAQAQTNVTGLVEGTYNFELTVTDNSGASATDVMQVTVNAAPRVNQPPVADAGENKSLTLPFNRVTLSGTGTDTDGTVVAYKWSKVSGPSSFIIANTDRSQTSVDDLGEGEYDFELTVTDNEGATGSSRVHVTVFKAVPPPAKLAPVAIAGNNLTITLPENSVELTGQGYDADGSITGYKWRKISGPAATIVSANETMTAIRGLVEGAYKFEFEVTDNDGLIGKDTLSVTVLSSVSKVTLFPNPASSVINLQIESSVAKSQTNVRVYDAKGMMVASRSILRNQQNLIMQLDVSAYQQGVYYVEIELDINNKKTVQFVKM